MTTSPLTSAAAWQALTRSAYAGSAVEDVRMAQFAANRELVEGFARQARQDGFRGLFAVISDPVDPLAKAALLAPLALVARRATTVPLRSRVAGVAASTARISASRSAKLCVWSSWSSAAWAEAPGRRASSR